MSSCSAAKSDPDFHELLLILSNEASYEELFRVLFNIIERRRGNSDEITLLLQSIRVLSVNNEKFSLIVLNKLEDLMETLFDDLIDKYLFEFVLLLDVISYYSDSESAATIYKFIETNKLTSKSDEILRKVYSILSNLAKYGEIFTEDMVLCIAKKLNYPGKSPLDAEIIIPCMTAVDNLLLNENTIAYKKLSERCSYCFSKITHSVFCAYVDKQDPLLTFSLRSALAFYLEFPNSICDAGLTLRFCAALNYLKKAGDDEQQHIASYLLDYLRLS